MWGSLLSFAAPIAGAMIANKGATDRNNAQIAASERANAQSLANMRESNAWSAEQYAKRYQVELADIEKAGLNPALMYSRNAGAGPSTVSTSAQAPHIEDTLSPAVSSFLQAKMNSAQVANISADTENKKAQAELIQAQAAHYRSSASRNEAEINRTGAEIEKIKEQLPNIREDTQRLRFLQQTLAEQAALYAQQGETEVARRQHLSAMVANLLKDGIIKDADIKAINDTGGIGRIAREMKPVVDIGTDVIDALKIWKGKKK